MAYFDIYKKRLNRYGTDYPSRLQGKREEHFERSLTRSTEVVTFAFGGKNYDGKLTRFQQKDSKRIMYLLTPLACVMPSGTLVDLPNVRGVTSKWMIFYEEEIVASGYNRYVVIKMTHNLAWKDRNGVQRTSPAYMYGQEDNMLKNEIVRRSRSAAVYAENMKLSFFLMPANANITKDDYFVVTDAVKTEYYRVTGYDIQSQLGVEYVTVDPIYEFDQTPPPIIPEPDTDQDGFWFK